jgi:lipoprotein-releasing system permease protein
VWRTRQDVIAAAQQPVRVLDWQQANSSFFNAVQVERTVMFLILTLIILVAAFNIISSLIMLVKDKSRDIAILRTMGASRGSILRIFFMAGASIGVLGTFAGLGLGLLFNVNIEHIRQFLQWITGTQLFSAEVYFLATMPSKTDPNEVVQVILMALGLSFLATIYPAWRAARLDPVEALRYE